MPKFRAAAATMLVAGILGLAGCGAAFPGLAEKPSSRDEGAVAFAIATASLPDGRVDAEYPETVLRTSGSDGPVTWEVASGDLPPGLGLSAAGALSGRPAAEGDWRFTVRANDGAASATRSYAIAVGVLALDVEGLHLGVAWSERPVTLRARGASGEVTFAVVEDRSGGTLLAADRVAGVASWSPGRDAGPDVVARLRATDAAGASVEVALRVLPDPAAHLAAEPGTDVWYVDTSHRFGKHGYATDVHAALVRLGLRDPASKDLAGTPADDLAAYLVRLHLLRTLNLRFQREADGRAGARGLPITFPMDRPAGYAVPAAGSWLPGGAGRASVLSVHAGAADGVMGLAFQDGSTNALHEHNVRTADGDLGVFVDKFVDTFRLLYPVDDLVATPVSAADVPALEALLYGWPSAGGRAETLHAVIEGFARAVGETCAHEIAHSVGLPHTNPRRDGSLMNPGLFLSPTLWNEFLPEDLARLATALPGVGRGSGTSAPASGLPEGGVEASVCTLRAEDPDARPLPCWAVPDGASSAR